MKKKYEPQQKLKIKLVYFTRKFIRGSVDKYFHPAVNYLKNFALNNAVIKNRADIILDTFTQEESIKNVIDKLLSDNPDIIGFSCYVWNITHTLKICKKIKEKDKKKILILGGPEIEEIEKILTENPFIDICVKGEGEEIFTSILFSYIEKISTGYPRIQFLTNHRIGGVSQPSIKSGTRKSRLSNGSGFSLLSDSLSCREQACLFPLPQYSTSALKNIEGIGFREKKRIIINPGRGLIKDLNNLPRIFTEDFVKDLKGEIFYQISRGCYFKCKYCEVHPPRRNFPFERVEKELKLLLSNKNIERIDFIDTDLDIDINYTKKIIDVIKIYNRHNIEFIGNFEFQSKDEQFYKSISECNFSTLLFGIQTTNKEVLKNIGRQWAKTEVREQTIKNIEKYITNKNIECSVILGLPGDTYTSFKETLNWCQKMNISHIEICRLLVLPNTEFRINSEKYRLKFQKNPYYKVYHNKTFPKETILKAQILSVWFNILLSLTWDKSNSLKMLTQNNIYITDIAEKFPFLDKQKIEFFGVDETGYIGSNIRKDKQVKNLVYNILKKLSLKDEKIKLFLEIIS